MSLTPRIDAIEDPTQMTDALATKLGYKEYTLTFTSTPAGWTVQRAIGIPYQTQNGNWRLRFNISATVTAGTSIASTVVGVTFSSSYALQAIAVFGDIAGSRGRASAGSGEIRVEHTSADGNFNCSGDVELDSKPSWAA